MDDKKKEKSRISMIIDGDIEPATKEERKYLNLRKRTKITDRPEKEQLQIRRNAAAASAKVKREKKSAKESIQNILSLCIDDNMLRRAAADPAILKRIRETAPNATLYDLVNIVAIDKAIDGSIRAAEYVRDTAGDKPTDKIQADINNVMTDADRQLLQSLSDRIGAGTIEVVKDI